MSTVLALTVGGSCAPIVTAIRDYQPDFVCFIATGGSKGSRLTVDGAGTPCRSDAGSAPSIVAQAGLPADRYQIVELDDPDALSDIYAMCRQALRALAARFPAARYIADYTGGSKSMGVGLALAALEAGWQLSLVKGMRPDLIKVADGTEMAGLVNTWEVRARQQMEEARRLFNDFAYASAAELLQGLLRQAPLSPELDQTIRKWVTYCRGLDAWDRFDHRRAVDLLSTVPGEAIDWRFLKALSGETRATGYEPVLDLVRNAERRAARGRFDDAVARLYRAVELFAQTRLLQREPPLDSGNLDLDRLPPSVRPRYEKIRELSQSRGEGAEVKLGLLEDYALLVELDDPLGQVFKPREKRLREALKRRNHSILAHGGKPIGQEGYEQMHSVVQELVTEGLAALGIRLSAPQFPRLESDGLYPRPEAG